MLFYSFSESPQEFCPEFEGFISKFIFPYEESEAVTASWLCHLWKNPSFRARVLFYEDEQNSWGKEHVLGPLWRALSEHEHVFSSSLSDAVWEKRGRGAGNGTAPDCVAL